MPTSPIATIPPSTGSFNWTYSALNGNDENLLLSDDQSLVRSYDNEFATLWKLFAVVTPQPPADDNDEIKVAQT